MFLGEEKENAKRGQKAKNLSLLKSAGFSVPPGFTLTREEYKNRTQQELDRTIEKIGGYPVAVRSSGTLEDLGEASFAGQYESFLNVSSAAELEQAIEKCLASSETERVITYLREKGLDPNLARDGVCVLVQKMVPATYAGVAFTLNPINGKDEELLIEYIEGLGEELVAGKKSPSSITVNRFDKRTPEGNPYRESFSKLLEECLKIQAYYGSPQDIEWAIDKNGDVFILQSRPITKIQWRTDRGEFTNADFKDGGVSARVCTALMYSLYEKSVSISMSQYFFKIGLLKKRENPCWIDYHYGRPYWSSGEVKRLLLKIPGFNEDEFDRDLGIQKDYAEAGPRQTGYSPFKVLGAIPILLKLNKEYKKCEKMVQNFNAFFEPKDNYWKKRLQIIEELSDEDVSHDFEQMIHGYYLQTEPSYFRVIYNNSNYQSEFKSLLARLEKKTQQKFSYINLIDHIRDIPHIQIQEDLQKLKALKESNPEGFIAAKHEFLSRHYHHAQVELDLSVPRWGEDPTIVDELVSKTSVNSANAKNRSYEKERDKVLKALESIPGGFVMRRLFLRKLEKARNFISLRERMRTYSTRSYYIVRQYLLELGERLTQREVLSQQEDIFMLKVEDILAYLKGKKGKLDLIELVGNSKLYYRGFRHFSAPNDFGQGILTHKSETLQSNGALKGLACSGGSVRGKAQVVKSLEEANRVEKGDILIAPFTDPGWTPLLGRVSGVVTEVGGVLSHAAVISREYGIPAVLNVEGATQSIPSGSEIFVDGDKGTVEILTLR